MTPPIKSMLSCLVIVATASAITIHNIREEEELNQLIVKDGNTIVLGVGMDPSRLPILAYSLKPGFVEIYLYLQSQDSCHLTYDYLHNGVIDFKTVKQLTSNRIALLFSGNVPGTVTTIFSLVATDACEKMVTLNYRRTSKIPFTVTVVPFDDGFELITSEDNRAKYDINGKHTGDTEYFPINSFDFSISSASESGDGSGYFIVDHTYRVLNHMDTDGKYEKLLLNLDYGTQVLSNNEQSLYSACTFDKGTKKLVTCYQFDQTGYSKWKHEADIEFDEILDVKNLARGGLVFAALKSEGNKLFFVKMGNKSDQVSGWSYSGKNTLHGARLMDFSEQDQTFILAYIIGRPPSGSEASVVWKKYALEN